ncbi:GreA/GreB family elongation factor [Pontiella sulfatireligans]|uniref:Transcription elongation factor GreA n=1 Tax=Pontiella sulfatireligans TaxID=2750658 RepID=A0A6C2UK12_9BACT|nr:GreA/GreB family elongation factor [Pontiella sulfatireligans]VGO20570.1 Transcription elongation factor GreA [Pontiella sulfatireligans]
MDLSAINEEWFTGQLESAEIDVAEVVGVFDAMLQEDRGSEAKPWAQSLFQKLAEAGLVDGALLVLEWLAVNRSVDDAKGAVNKLLSSDRNALKMIEPAGFGGKLPVGECFKRLRHLRSLKVGMLCFNATWGFGIIKDLDYFYQQLEVDFENKGEHEMSFSYAAEALEVLDEGHLLAIKYNNAAELERMIKEEPAEVARITLRSYGNMPVTRLQSTLTPSVFPEAKWKKFWETARRELKMDASVEIPKKRSDNIVLHKKAMAYDDEWFGLITEIRDIEELFDRFNEIIEKKIDITTDAAKAALAERLAFIIKGAPSGRPEWKAQGFIFASIFEIEPADVDTAKLIHDLIDGDLVVMLDRLPSRQLQTLLAIMIENDRDAVIATLSEVIPVVSHPVLNEVMAALISCGAEEEVRQIMTVAVAKRTASAPMLLWVQRSAEYVEKWGLITKGDLAFRIQEVLEVNSMGAMLRAQNQLRERFQQEGWLHDVMDAMTEQQRRDFLRRTNEGQGWDALDRKSVIAKVLRKFPELQDIILPSKNANTVKRQIPLTSSRSYVERQKQLERIMTVDIPENSKEIEVARSYGDLRENAEFKYAKERQGLLMAQGAQLAEDLEKIKPSDFADAETDVVGMGTGVELVYPGGAMETFYVLGAWDQDEVLSIISSETALAKALMGHKEGEMLQVPTGECELKAILPLSDQVKAWIKG